MRKLREAFRRTPRWVYEHAYIAISVAMFWCLITVPWMLSEGESIQTWVMLTTTVALACALTWGAVWLATEAWKKFHPASKIGDEGPWWMLFVSVGLGIAAFVAVPVGLSMVAEQFFGVPERCACRATVIPPDLSDASILDNSISDSRYVTIGTNGYSDYLSICYAEKPNKGKARTDLNDTCKWRMEGYELGEHQVLGISDTQTIISVRVTDSNESDKSQLGSLYLNRETNACWFLMDEWSQDWKKELHQKYLPGEMKCSGNKYYLNPWSHYQDALFYTRAFYALHKNKQQSKSNTGSEK